MRDPYLYPGTDILINKFAIKDIELLNAAEADFTSTRLKEIIEYPIKGNFDFEHLCKLHYHIFQDLYDWAGKSRIINIEKPEPVLGNISVEYCKFQHIEEEASSILSKMNGTDWGKMQLNEQAKILSQFMAQLWKAHPFREGNTRTVVTFCSQFAENKGFALDMSLFEKNSVYMRSALVAASAIFTDLGDRSKPGFLFGIVKDSMEKERHRKLLNRSPERSCEMDMDR